MADLNWAFSITDDMTKPLGHIDAALKHLPPDIAKVDKAIAQLERHEELTKISKMMPGNKRDIAMLRLYRKDMDAANKATMGHTKAAKSSGVGTAALTGFFTTIGSAALGAASHVLSAGKSFLEFALDASEGKKAAIAALEVFEGGNAEKVKDILEDMAKASGTNADKVSDMFVQLRGAGLEAKAAQDVVAAALDVSAMRGGGEKGAAAAEKFVEMMAKIETVAKSSPKDLKLMALQLGISTDALADKLAKNTGQTAAAALAQLEAGKADAVAIQESVLDVIQERGGGGPFGALAKKFQAGSVKGQLESFKTSFGNLFENVDFTPIAGALAKVRAFIDDPGTNKAITEAFKKLGPIMGQVVDAGERVFAVFRKTFEAGPAKEMLGAIGKVVEKVDLLSPASIDSWGKALGYVATVGAAGMLWLAGTFEAVVRVANFLRDAFVAIVGGVADMGKAIGDLFLVGDNIANGLVNGILSGVDKVKNAATTMGKAAIDSFKSILGIRSPSKVFEQLGEFTGEGFSRGLDASMPDIGIPANDFTAASLAGGSSGGGIVINMGNITITGVDANNARDVGAAVQRDVKSALMSALEELAIA